MQKLFFLLSTLFICISCSTNKSSDKTNEPSFKIKELSFFINEPMTIIGINRYSLDKSIIKKNHIKQFICYEEFTEVRGAFEVITEWKMSKSCTFDTTGNWVQYKTFDKYGISDNTDNNEPTNKTNTNNKKESYWINNEYFEKSDSLFYYAKYNVEDGIGYIVFDSIFSIFKNNPLNSARIFRGDTVISKIKNQITNKAIYTRNINGLIEKIQEIDIRGLHEIRTYQYFNGFVSSYIRQNLLDMTESIYINVIEFNEMSLPINFKCYALDNSKTAVEEYNSGSKKAKKISEIKVDWIN